MTILHKSKAGVPKRSMGLSLGSSRLPISEVLVLVYHLPGFSNRNLPHATRSQRLSFRRVNSPQLEECTHIALSTGEELEALAERKVTSSLEFIRELQPLQVGFLPFDTIPTGCVGVSFLSPQHGNMGGGSGQSWIPGYQAPAPIRSVPKRGNPDIPRSFRKRVLTIPTKNQQNNMSPKPRRFAQLHPSPVRSKGLAGSRPSERKHRSIRTPKTAPTLRLG